MAQAQGTITIDENTGLVGNQQKPVQIDHDIRAANYRQAVNSAQWAFGTHLIWAIAFFSVYSNTDATTCTGPLYSFGDVARFFLLGFVVWDAITFAVMKWYQKHPDPQHDTPPGWFTWVNGLYYLTLFGFWIYSIVALAERTGCTGQSLTTLTWIWVIVYAVLPYVVICCLCCAGAAFIGGAALSGK